MKLAVLLLAALLLAGCPGNTAQNAPTPSQGGVGRPETPGVAPMSTSAPRSGLNVISAPVATISGERNLSGSIGAPTGVASGPKLGRRLVSMPESPTAAGAPHFARTGIGTAAGALRGTARWFATGPNGVAAAGPRLRAALGSHWRGTLVGVTYRSRTVWLRVGDWCACGSGSIIDLPDEVFRKLAPLSRGVLAVTVHWGDRNTLPATDMAP